MPLRNPTENKNRFSTHFRWSAVVDRWQPIVSLYIIYIHEVDSLVSKFSVKYPNCFITFIWYMIMYGIIISCIVLSFLHLKQYIYNKIINTHSTWFNFEWKCEVTTVPWTMQMFKPMFEIQMHVLTTRFEVTTAVDLYELCAFTLLQWPQIHMWICVCWHMWCTCVCVCVFTTKPHRPMWRMCVY